MVERRMRSGGTRRCSSQRPRTDADRRPGPRREPKPVVSWLSEKQDSWPYAERYAKWHGAVLNLAAGSTQPDQGHAGNGGTALRLSGGVPRSGQRFYQEPTQRLRVCRRKLQFLWPADDPVQGDCQCERFHFPNLRQNVNVLCCRGFTRTFGVASGSHDPFGPCSACCWWRVIWD